MAWIYVAIIVISTVASDLLQSWEMKRQGEVTDFGAAGIGRLLGLPPEHWAALGVLTNCSWSVLLENSPPGPAWRLQEYNAGSLPESVPVDGVWPADDR